MTSAGGEFEVPAALDRERLDRVVSIASGASRAEVAAWITSGAVRVGGSVVTVRSTRVGTGDVIDVDIPDRADGEPAPEDVPFTVVHDDPDVIVVDKPPGVVVHPGAGTRSGTLVNGLVRRYPGLLTARGVGQPGRPGIVHRLDAGTSGLLVVARTAHAYEALVDQLQRRTVERVYVALVLGEVEAAAGLVDAPVGRHETDRTRMAVVAYGRVARTGYTVQGRFEHPRPLSLVECRLETGRTHQIRVHMASIGHPVVGDPRYGGVRQDLPLERPFLHASRLSFDHPATGDRVSFESPLPPDLAALLSDLRQ